MSLRRTELKRKTPIKRTRSRSSIRTLRSDEPIPDFTPKRYTDGRGYIRLRWKVGTESYVEDYEHRVVMDRPAGEVHHINGVKADNRPENLLVLSKREHAELHERLAKEADPLRGDPTKPGTVRGNKSLAAAARRLQRSERIAAMKADYRAGMTTIEIGTKYGVHSSNVSRALRNHGTIMRSTATNHGNALKRSRQVVKARARMRCERCNANTTWTGGQVHHRLPRGMGGSSREEIHSPANLVLLCPECHSHVESNRETAYADGWLVRRGLDPAGVPVAIFGRPAPVVLTPDGDYEDVAA